MVTTIHCPHCGRDVPRPSTLNARCPACQGPLAASPGAATPLDRTPSATEPASWTPPGQPDGAAPVPDGGYEDLELEPEPDVPKPTPTLRPPPRPILAAAEPPAPRRHQSEPSLAAARMASAPTFRSINTRSGIPVIPIALGVVLVLAIAAFALTRERPATQAITGLSPEELKVKIIGRPPEPTTPPAAEPETPPPTVTMDPPSEASTAARERRKPAEREAPARLARPPPPPPIREVARVEKPVAPPRPAPAPKVEPDPPLPPPPQFVAAPPQEPPTASTPLAIGPTYAREGYQKARQTTPGCVVNSLRLPRDIVDLEGTSATVKFAVDETGKVSQFSYLSGPTDQRVANAIWAAVQRCEWTPGSTAQGRPISLWVMMPVKFGR